MLKLFKPKNKILSIKQHYNRRNKVLILRKAGGFGDIVMQRMMIEDFAKTGLEIDYSCPSNYMEIMKNHPYINKLKEFSQIREEDYGMIYDITTICAVTESSLGSKNKKHRSDIWANHCGVDLTRHETYLKSDPEEFENYKKEFKKINKPIIFLSTKSVNNQFGEAKSLNNDQVIKIAKELQNLGYHLITANEEFQEIYETLEIKQFVNLSIKKWIALIDACDCVISIDTASFHIAGALKKPLIGIFSFTDGKIYGKYYDFILVQKHRDNGDWDCGPCYCYTSCIKDKINNKKPCITEITSNMIVDAFISAQNRWGI